MCVFVAGPDGAPPPAAPPLSVTNSMVPRPDALFPLSSADRSGRQQHQQQQQHGPVTFTNYVSYDPPPAHTHARKTQTSHLIKYLWHWSEQYNPSPPNTHIQYMSPDLHYVYSFTKCMCVRVFDSSCRRWLHHRIPEVLMEQPPWVGRDPGTATHPTRTWAHYGGIISYPTPYRVQRVASKLQREKKKRTYSCTMINISYILLSYTYNYTPVLITMW